MSRKRKRRGKATPAPHAPEDIQDDGLEIVDDVHLLDGEAPTSSDAAGQDVSVQDDAPVEAKPAAASPDASSDADAVEPQTVAAADAADVAPATDAAEDTGEGDGDAGATVHVVEPLHETPSPAADADRTVETLGELLQHAREAKGLSLEEVSARTRIALMTLRHLENDRFSELPAEAYVKGFLRSYGGFLGLDVAMLLRRYEKLSGHVSAPVAEVWDEVEVDRGGVKLWRPSRRTVAIGGAVLVVAALAWVFWSQGAVMLGLRPEGELQQIEMQLQREARDGSTPQTSITGLDDAALQQEPDAADAREDAGVASPQSSPQPQTSKPASQVAPVEDTSPPVPQPPLKPALPRTETRKPAASSNVSGTPAVSKPAVRDAGSGAADDKKKDTQKVTPAKKPESKPAPAPQKKTPRKTTKKPVKKSKPAPTPSPEDAAGPPA